MLGEIRACVRGDTVASSYSPAHGWRSLCGVLHSRSGAFVNAGEADLIELRPTFAPLRSITDRTMPSDHAPMGLTFQEPRRGLARARIPG